MKVYCCMGGGFDDASNGHFYYRTKEDALAAARDNSEDGATVTVSMSEVIAPLNHERVVALLNGEGWSRGAVDIAVVQSGRVVETLR